MVICSFNMLYLFRYFETFDMLSGTSFKEHSNWNERFAQCKSQEELGEYTLIATIVLAK